jgi:hypothetical protein
MTSLGPEYLLGEKTVFEPSEGKPVKGSIICFNWILPFFE